MFRKTLLAASLVLAGATATQAATMEDVERSFYPYEDGVPTVDGLTPGTVVTAGNVDPGVPSPAALADGVPFASGTAPRPEDDAIFDS